MRKNEKKVLITVLTGVALLAVLIGVFAYIYFGTDMLMSEKKLFAKYLIQNIVELNQTVNAKKINDIEEKLKESKYEENITISYTEAEETEPMGEITIDIQNDSINKKIYCILSLMMEGVEDSLEIEYMEKNDMYSLRFTDAVKEFVSIENADLKQLAIKLGIDKEIVEQKIPDTIDFEKFSFENFKFTEDEKNAEINRYLKLLYNNIAKENYKKNNNMIITLNGKTIETNAYILTLNMQDLRNLKIKLLETLKQDEIVLSKLQKIDEILQEYGIDTTKNSFVNKIQEKIDSLNKEEIIENENFVITLYEQNKKTVRIKVEQGLEYITLDTDESKKQIDINYTRIDEENIQLSNKVTFIKENDNKLSIQLNNIEGEEQYNINLSVELTENENNTKIDIIILGQENKITFSRNINIVDEINYDVILDETNNKVLNELSEERISYILDILGKRLKTEYVEPLGTALESVIKRSAIEGTLDDVEESLINSEIVVFNSKFEVYEGTLKSAQQVNILLNTVYLHNSLEKQKDNPKYVTVTGVVSLDKDTNTIEKVQEGNYSIQCLYEDSFINEIRVSKENEIQQENLFDIDF